MSIEITCREFWTYNTTTPKAGRKENQEKLPLEYLNKMECTHIHGELQIVIDGRIVPHLGIGSVDDVCIGYWIGMLSHMLAAFKSNTQSYVIEGGDQGKPAYKFEKEHNILYLSIIDSVLGGKKDLNWQRIKMQYRDFKNAFNEFKKKLLMEIALKAPDMLEIWEGKFFQYD